MQVPAQFEYDRATTVEEAIGLLSRAGPEARVLAGGHSLIPMMKLRLAQPELLVDINDVTELTGIAVEGDELRMGALVRHAELLASPLVAEHFPIMRDAEHVIADPVVRNRGTIGGSVCQADPSEDLSAVFAAVGAVAVVRGPDGERTVSMREFFLGPFETVVGSGELLVELRVPIRPGAGSAYEKVKRRLGDWAIVGAAAALWLDCDGVVRDVGIGLTAVGAEHFVARQAERFLRGRRATDDDLKGAGNVAAGNCNPVADQRGPVDYKRHLTVELTTRALRRARARATGREA